MRAGTIDAKIAVDVHTHFWIYPNGLPAAVVGVDDELAGVAEQIWAEMSGLSVAAHAAPHYVRMTR